MDDPWKNIDSTVSARLEISEDRCTNFSDSFCPQSVETTDVDSSKLPFEKLPDSSQYLANLEKKLQKVQKKLTVCSAAEKRDLLLSLSGTREGHINRLLNKPAEDTCSFEENFDQSINNSLTTTLVRHIAPHLQAVNTVELVELLRADHLETTNIEDTVDLENILNTKTH